MLPSDLQTLQYQIYAQPLLPQGNSTINLQQLEYNCFAEPFVANNIQESFNIIKVSGALFINIGKVSQTLRSNINKISGVSK